jgi:hypothetical protein
MHRVLWKSRGQSKIFGKMQVISIIAAKRKGKGLKLIIKILISK